MKLVFVYHAKSGKVNALFDMAHKMLKPETYACSLCSLTHGVFREKAAWAQFRQESGVEFEFLHLDERGGLPNVASDLWFILKF